jgi:hypothetical protein
MRTVILADDFDITRERTAAQDHAQLFDAEEMQAIRDQYEERIALEVAKREELEWQVRMMLANVRDAELDARRAADQMRKVHSTLQELLGGKAEARPAAPPHEPRPAPVLGVAPVLPAAKLDPVVPTAPKFPLRSSPPPIPLNGNSRGPLPPRPLGGYRR